MSNSKNVSLFAIPSVEETSHGIETPVMGYRMKNLDHFIYPIRTFYCPEELYDNRLEQWKYPISSESFQRFLYTKIKEFEKHLDRDYDFEYCHDCSLISACRKHTN